jgi:hypothetical protein
MTQVSIDVHALFFACRTQVIITTCRKTISLTNKRIHLHPPHMTYDHKNSSAVGRGNCSPCAHDFKASASLHKTSSRPRRERICPSDETITNEGIP